MEHFFYYLIFCLIFVAVMGIYLSRNPIFAIVSLVLIIILASILLFYLGIEFIALVLLVVYVGAVSVLFLFVVMLIGTRYAIISMDSMPSWFVGIIFMLVLLLFGTFFLFFHKGFASYWYVGNSLVNDNFLFLNDFNNLTILSYNILSSYFVILAAFILLVAMLGSIFLND